MKNVNPILNVDSYKASHFLQYPQGTTRVSSYIEARGNGYDRVDLQDTLYFGLQAYLKQYLQNPISRNDVDEAQVFWTEHGLPFNRDGWDHIVNKHGGFFPIRIQSIPEGTVVPLSNVLVQMVNTDPVVPWVTSYLETSILRAVWYPTTVATISMACKRIIYKSLLKTSDDPDGQILFKLHDFGARGASSLETAGIGGLAHLVNFMGTDTVSGIILGRQTYNTKDMLGFSIPAAEHSTITSWGGPEFEVDSMKNMLDQFGKPGALLAVVSDSYDIFNAVKNIWGNKLRQQVIDSGAIVVVRPDSGDPVTVVTQVVKDLAESFGTQTNGKGYKVLNNVRVIQGDGVNPESIQGILTSLENNGFSADNIAFGMGGALLQRLDRDTLKFAMKASAIEVNGVWRDVFKQPITDTVKKSKKGILALVKENGEYRTVNERGLTSQDVNVLRPVFENGQLLVDENFATIRDRARSGM